MPHSPGPEAARRLINFLNASPTPFHAVHMAALRLERAGFVKIRESDQWEKDVKAGGKYYYTRNQASLVAFALPQKWQPGTGLSIVATHVDSPNLRIRPISKRSKAGYLQVGVETYGGGIWHSWLDRDLSVAGRIITAHSNGGFTSNLVKIDRPVLRIPTLAIHLDKSVDTALKFNQETEFVPVLGQTSAQLNGFPNTSQSGTQRPSSKEENAPVSGSQSNHHPALLSLLADEMSITAEEIHDFEISLYDTQPSVLGGLNNEFVLSGRLDNLFSSFCAVEALVDSVSQGSPTLGRNVNCIALFNHEEVGSVSATGAESSLIPSLIGRLSPSPMTLGQSTSRSFLISADMSHAVHPNYTSKHEDNHTPEMNGGIVIKTNAKQRYTSDAVGSFLVKQLVERIGGKVQEYEVRNDMPCGSTVGPMLSKSGIRTVDIGCAMLSMHSIREMAGSHDVQACIDFFGAFFQQFAEVDRTLNAD